jgi:hypothetical protein
MDDFELLCRQELALHMALNWELAENHFPSFVV